MKKKLDAILVVEGKSDVALLSNYIDCEFVITNGSDVPKETISYLKNVKDKKIIVLTDPDSPGKKIRDKLDENIPNLNHVFIPKEKAIKHNKVGVAECDIDTILEALGHVWVSNNTQKSTISMAELIKYGLAGSPDADIRRKRVADKLHMGHVNAKTFLKRINNNNISLEEVIKLSHDE